MRNKEPGSHKSDRSAAVWGATQGLELLHHLLSRDLPLSPSSLVHHECGVFRCAGLCGTCTDGASSKGREATFTDGAGTRVTLPAPNSTTGTIGTFPVGSDHISCDRFSTPDLASA